MPSWPSSRAPVAPKHLRIVKCLADHGFFRAGGILVGTHALKLPAPERYAVHKLVI